MRVLRNATNVDGSETSTVAGSHVLVEGVDGISTGHFPVLLVHVVGAGARVVADPDTEVLDLEWSLLVDLIPTISLHFSLISHQKTESSIPR